VLLLTDMFGGTPSNLRLSFLDAGRIEVLTGTNLPMLIKLAKTPAGGDLWRWRAISANTGAWRFASRPTCCAAT
jgi:mannose/fructose-specific phosphotransferase system component IIA